MKVYLSPCIILHYFLSSNVSLILVYHKEVLRKQTPNSLIYVGFSSNNNSAVKAFMNDKWNVTELSFFAINPKIIRLFNKMKFSKLSNILSNRIYLSRLKNVNRKSYGMVSIFAPLLNKLGINNGISRKLLKILYRCDKSYVTRTVKKYDIAIIPSDYLNKYFFTGRSRIIEARWSHPNLMINRPAVLLDYPIEFFEKDDLWRNIFDDCKHKIDLLITYSQISSDSYIKAGFPKDRIFCVPLEVNLNTAKIKNSQNVNRQRKILYVGRDNLDKGLDIAVAVAKILGLNLIVVGYFSKKVQFWLKQFSFVEFIGVLPRYELFKFMQNTELYISPGIESFGLAAVEAFLNGMKVISTRFTGASQWYGDNANWYIAESLDVNSMVSTCNYALKSDSISSMNSHKIDSLHYWQNISSFLVNQESANKYN